MPNITLISPIDKQRMQANTSLNVDFSLDQFVTSATNCTIKIFFSDTINFSSPTILTPTSLYYSTDGVNFNPYSSNNIIQSTDTDKIFRAVVTFPNSETIQYIKISDTDDSIEYFSHISMLSAYPTIDFCTKKITLTERPLKVKVVDEKTIIDPEHVVISVYATNNALDITPLWEDITSAYNNNQFYSFTNITKTDTNWAISIKYLITKNLYTAGVEITEIFVAHL